MILAYKKVFPSLHPSVFVAPSADVIGDVNIGEDSNIWFQVLIRGDVNRVSIGCRTNIQDQSCLHVTRAKADLKIGDDVTIGHKVMLHGCHIQNRVLIGMGAVIMDQARIEDDCIVGAGSLITEGKCFSRGQLILGSPAKAIRALTEEELRFLKLSAANYVKDAQDYREISINPKIKQ
ncbi:MAG: gamma carbonic anhydrase family protein [Deltaproteobacteria bacterium CG11_big_fil_rev_8_21_14_0_20_45_16]|nr:MAG: gamma carbonic anhydrase family protein [Deltaproteobacteria bacterium CG11_big_fil_rev_8_21_14_0_20_45_16]